MLRRISKLSFFVQFLIFIGLAALLWIPELMHPKLPVRLPTEGPIYILMAEALCNHLYLSATLSMLMVIGLSILLYLIGTTNDILPRENFLPAIIYLFLLSWDSRLLAMNPIIQKPGSGQGPDNLEESTHTNTTAQPLTLNPSPHPMWRGQFDPLSSIILFNK